MRCFVLLPLLAAKNTLVCLSACLSFLSGEGLDVFVEHCFFYVVRPKSPTFAWMPFHIETRAERPCPCAYVCTCIYGVTRGKRTQVYTPTVPPRAHMLTHVGSLGSSVRCIPGLSSGARPVDMSQRVSIYIYMRRYIQPAIMYCPAGRHRKDSGATVRETFALRVLFRGYRLPCRSLMWQGRELQSNRGEQLPFFRRASRMLDT